MSIAIKVENLSKAYQLGEIGTGTLSRDASTELSMTAFPHIAFVLKDVEIVKKNNANDCRNLEGSRFVSAGQNKNAGRGACPVRRKHIFVLDFLFLLCQDKRKDKCYPQLPK